MCSRSRLHCFQFSPNFWNSLINSQIICSDHEKIFESNIFWPPPLPSSSSWEKNEKRKIIKSRSKKKTVIKLIIKSPTLHPPFPSYFRQKIVKNHLDISSTRKFLKTQIFHFLFKFRRLQSTQHTARATTNHISFQFSHTTYDDYENQRISKFHLNIHHV